MEDKMPPVPADADFLRTSSNLEDPELIFKVVMVGDPKVGKTSLVKRYVVNEFKEVQKSTIGGTFLSKNIEIDGVSVKLQIWDTAGQDKYRVLQSIYYRGAVGAFVVFDVNEPTSWERVKEGWLSEVNQQGDEGIVVMILGNKCDMPPEERFVQPSELREYALQNKAAYYQTSAKTSLNVEEAFSTMARVLFEQYRGRPSNTKVRAASVQLDKRSIGPGGGMDMGLKTKACCSK